MGDNVIEADIGSNVAGSQSREPEAAICCVWRNQDRVSALSRKIDKTLVRVIHLIYTAIEYLPDDAGERELHQWSRRRGKLAGLSILRATLSGKRIARRRLSGESAVRRTEGATPPPPNFR